MGDFLSKTKSFADYKPTNKSVVHPILGEFPLVQNPFTNECVITKRVSLAQLEAGNKAHLRQHLSLTHPNIIRFEGYEKLSMNEYSIFFETFDCTLKQEIQRRAATNTRFTEKEIVELLRNISSALAYLEGNRLVHGQIRTESIVKVGSEYKILNMTIFGNYKSTYQQALEDMRKTSIRLLSPQLQDALYNKIVDPVHEGYKDDVYALGVATLDLMTLSVDTGVLIADKLNRASQIYSKNLISLVNKMLENIMSLRLDCIACNRVIDNMCVPKDVIPKGLYTSRVLRNSYLSSSKAGDLEPRLSAGASSYDIKKYSPVYRSTVKSKVEPTYSTSPYVRSTTYLGDSNVGPSPTRNLDYNLDSGKSEEPFRVRSDSPLAKSYAIQTSNTQSPEERPLSSYTPSQSVTRPSVTESYPKNDYQNYEFTTSNVYKPTTYTTTTYTTYGNGNPTSYTATYGNGNPTSYTTATTTETAKKSFNHSNSVNLDNVNNRNLSPLIKNDPLILSILAQNSGLAKESKAGGYTTNGNSAGINTTSSYTPAPYTSEQPKRSGLYMTTDQTINSPYSSDIGGLKGRNQTNVAPITTAGGYLPAPGTYTATSYVSSLTDRPYYTSTNVNVPLSNMPNVNYLDPMAVDNSPIYTGYSQIEEGVHNTVRKSVISESRGSYNVNFTN